jgi:hypothetical protein
MSKQPEALRLAAHAEANASFGDMKLIAAELRRLHEINGALLHALENIEMVGNENGASGMYLAKLARKAIAKTEGQKA